MYLLHQILVNAGCHTTSAALWLGVKSGGAWNPTLYAQAGAAFSAFAWRIPRRRPSARNGLAQYIAARVERIMLGGAENSFFLDRLKGKTSQDLIHARDIARHAEVIAEATQSIAEGSGRACEVASRSRLESERGRAEISRGLESFQNARDRATATAADMRTLQEQSTHIQRVADVIGEIAMQTHLISLNASIISAQAGEHGKGFAVLAHEVRALANKARDASIDIVKSLEAVNQQADRTVASMQSLSEDVNQGAAQATAAVSLLAGIGRLAAESEQEIQHIATMASSHVEATRQISAAVQVMLDGLAYTESELPKAANASLGQADVAEELFEATFDQANPLHLRLRAVVQDAAHRIGKQFESDVESQRISLEALLDRHYQPVPGSKPEKFHTTYDGYTDEVLPVIQEPILESNPEVTFACAMDDHCYIGTHNHKFAQPLTGNYDTDIRCSRSKRFFNDRTSQRATANRKPYLLHTYKRDTGETMYDISSPIYVHGQHWGLFRIGYRPPVEAGECIH